MDHYTLTEKHILLFSYECIVSLIELHLIATSWQALIMLVNLPPFPSTESLTALLYLLNHDDRKDEPITPQQTELLKVLDAHLQDRKGLQSKDYTFLIPATATFVTYARNSVNQALSPNLRPPSRLSPLSEDPESSASSSLSQAPDVKLPPVVGALVLTLQCSLTISLGEIGSNEVAERVYSDSFKEYPSLLEDIVGESMFNCAAVSSTHHQRVVSFSMKTSFASSINSFRGFFGGKLSHPLIKPQHPRLLLALKEM